MLFAFMVVFTFSPHEDPDAVMTAFKHIGNRAKNKRIRFIAVFQPVNPEGLFVPSEPPCVMFNKLWLGHGGLFPSLGLTTVK